MKVQLSKMKIPEFLQRGTLLLLVNIAFPLKATAAPAEIALFAAKNDIVTALQEVNASASYEESQPSSGHILIPNESGGSDDFTFTRVTHPVTESLPSGYKAFSIFNEQHEGALLLADQDVYITIWDRQGQLMQRIVPHFSDPSGGLYEFHYPPWSSPGTCSSSTTPETVEVSNGGTTEANFDYHVSSQRLTEPALRYIRLAVNMDKSYFSFYRDRRFAAAANLVLSANQRFFKKDLNVLLIPAFFDYPNEDLNEQTSADKFIGRPGIFAYDIGHLFRGFWLESNVSGQSLIGTVCGHGSDVRSKGVAYTVASIAASERSIDIEKIFAHEIGHQLGLNHIFSECPGGAPRFARSALEAADGASVMGYRGMCGFTREDYPTIQATQFSAKSIEAVATMLHNDPRCGKQDVTSLTYPEFDLQFDKRVPYLTRFSIPITIRESLTNPYRLTAESVLKLPATPDSTARLQPLVATNSSLKKAQYSSGSTIRIDFPSYGFNSDIICTRDYRIWGTAGCFGSTRSKFSHPFMVKFDKGTGAVSAAKVSIDFTGDVFGFSEGYLDGRTLAGGTKVNITWSVGGGAIAPTVALYFVYVDTVTGILSDNQTLFPETFGNKYRVIHEALPNTGSAAVSIPNINRSGYLLLVPNNLPKSPPFIFWSRSDFFNIKCSGIQRRDAGTNSTCPSGEQCECETTPTPTPSGSSTRSPTVTPTQTANFSTPTPTIPIPTPTPTLQITPTPSPTATACISTIKKLYPCRERVEDINTLAQFGSIGFCQPGYLEGLDVCDTSWSPGNPFRQQCEANGGNGLRYRQYPPDGGKPIVDCIGRYESGEGCNWAHSVCEYGLTLECVNTCSGGGSSNGGY